MSIEVDRDRCVGAGNCARTVPEVFDQDEDEGLVLVTLSSPPAELMDAVRQAVDLCPSGALNLS